ncbi:hypothetical protein [Halodesulfovibrio aestuarii]|uniref:hypothetical protein n=1 Tax=Halodesulfovibrio aestuarii TaxID=126333 RepID=UPI000417C8D4
MNKESVLRVFEESCPLFVTRKKVQELTGGLIKAKTLSNKDSLGLGPSMKVTIGKTVAYPRQALIDWLEDVLVVDYV